jgi:hypothetical protein
MEDITYPYRVRLATQKRQSFPAVEFATFNHASDSAEAWSNRSPDTYVVDRLIGDYDGLLVRSATKVTVPPPRAREFPRRWAAACVSRRRRQAGGR